MSPSAGTCTRLLTSVTRCATCNSQTAVKKWASASASDLLAQLRKQTSARTRTARCNKQRRAAVSISRHRCLLFRERESARRLRRGSGSSAIRRALITHLTPPAAVVARRSLPAAARTSSPSPLEAKSFAMLVPLTSSAMLRGLIVARRRSCNYSTAWPLWPSRARDFTC